MKIRSGENKKFLTVTFMFVIIFAIMLAMIMSLFTGCNKQIIDTTYAYNYAYIDLPGGDHVEGTVQSWTDFEDGDQIQVKIDGVVYLTNSSRVVLCKK